MTTSTGEHHLNGAWEIEKVPKEFTTIMKYLGYNGLERKYFKKSRITVYSTILDDNNKLQVKIDSPIYKTTKEYQLNSIPVEIVDDNKNNVMEVSRWVNDKKIEVKTLFLEKNITVLDTREILEDGNCLHKVSLITVEEDEPIEAEMIYRRK